MFPPFRATAEFVSWNGELFVWIGSPAAWVLLGLVWSELVSSAATLVVIVVGLEKELLSEDVMVVKVDPVPGIAPVEGLSAETDVMVEGKPEAVVVLHSVTG
jgi:hypothetical protein